MFRTYPRPLTRTLLVGIVIALAFVLLAGCAEAKPTASEKEDDSRKGSYSTLVENQPAHKMTYSPTRETKNFWIDTWGKKGKLSYVYLMNGQGDVFGYFILSGLPVSYCTGLVSPVTPQKFGNGADPAQTELVPAPSVDGTYSSGSNCNVFYGKDAVSGAYVEYTTGMGINALLFDAPLPQYGDAKPMGAATVDKVR